MNWFGSKNRKSFFIRLAKNSDARFIANEVIWGEQNGHYESVNTLNSEYKNFLINHLKNTLSTQVQYHESEKVDKYPLFEEYWVYESNKTGVIGFFKLQETDPPEFPFRSAIEINMFGINEKYHKLGNGNDMLRKILMMNSIPEVVVARCLHKSNVMFNLLIKNGFDYVFTDDENVNYLQWFRP